VTASEKILAPFYSSLNSELASDSLNFPTSFKFVEKAFRLLDDERSSLRDFTTLVQSEPIMLAKVLRVANSAALNSLGREITSVFEAVQRLGSKRLKVLAQLVIMMQFKHDKRNEELKEIANAIWYHSIDVACLSYTVSEYLKVSDPDEALITGIMSDVGQFYIISKLPDYPTITAQPKLIHELVINTHLSVTKQIVDAMKLPKVVLDVYDGRHHKPSCWPLTDLQDIVAFASVYCDHKNPFTQTIVDSKWEALSGVFSIDHFNQINDLLEKVHDKRRKLFDDMSS
jgi:HD-like signal output (HDOD) protein